MLRTLTLLLATFALGFLTAPPAQDDAEWTLVVLPDTQYYSRSHPWLYERQTQWIADHKDELNIKFVIHEGDVTNDNTHAQWRAASDAHAILDAAGVPYSLLTGNHDLGPSGNGSNRSTLMNERAYFHPDRFRSMPTYGGQWLVGHSENNYHTFSAGGRKWLALSLEFGPRDAVLAWANQVVADHPGHTVLMSTHAYTHIDGTRQDYANRPNQGGTPHHYGVDNQPGAVNDGEEMWQKFVSKHPNMLMVFSGHLGGFSGRQIAYGDHGNPVYEMLADYQGMDFGGSGYLRILRFLKDGRTVEVSSYSPWLDLYLEGNDRFDLEPTDGDGRAYTPAARYHWDGPGSGANLTIDAESGGWGLGRHDEGDLEPRQWARGFTFAQGVLMASVAENGRDHGFGAEYASASAVLRGNWFSSNFISVATRAAGPISATGTVPLNVDVASVFFPYAGGWSGGHFRATGTTAKGRTLAASSGLDIGHFDEFADGRVRIEVPGTTATSEGMLFTLSAGNGDNTTSTSPLPGGGGWEVAVRDNGGDLTQFERDSFSFVYLPFHAHGLVGGLIDEDGSVLRSAGNFALQRTSTGRYQVTIPGEDASSGVLLLTVCHDRAGYPDDKLLSYEATSTGFMIESRDLPDLQLEDTGFHFAFVSYERGLALHPVLITRNAVAGQPLEIQLHFATPGGPVLVAAALESDRPRVTSFGTAYLTRGFTEVHKVWPDADGRALLRVDLPAALQGRGLWLQALDSGAGTLSNFLAQTVE